MTFLLHLIFSFKIYVITGW